MLSSSLQTTPALHQKHFLIERVEKERNAEAKAKEGANEEFGGANEEKRGGGRGYKFLPSHASPILLWRFKMSHID
ncbi:hypothetical protein RHMOL_Rhmol02G0294000 [Rhododendron molle]|uniref:Uncharacterized protein n=1 Tax=Rhododendron molle TaxID=49168 RepID=A0ACC0PWW0_RHOML|nr:hypothetical protein RHMOL_Rhmol02G0294000 [Rhododendron molle]